MSDASVGFFLSVAFSFSILLINSYCSKIICMDGHTSFIVWLISIYILSLAWATVSAMSNSLSKFWTLSPNLWDFYISSMYNVSFLVLWVSKVLNFSNNFSFSCFCMANSYTSLIESPIVDLNSIDVDEELGSVCVTAIGIVVTGIMASQADSFSLSSP